MRWCSSIADAAAQGVVDALQELQLRARTASHGLPVPALQRQDVAQAHVGAHDHDALLARQELLLELDGAASGGLARAGSRRRSAAQWASCSAAQPACGFSARARS